MAKYNTDKVVDLKGKRYILFEGILEIAHAEHELTGIETELIQIPNEANKNAAICKATVTTKDGKAFTGYGDASPENVGKMITPHIIRMSETRAIGRALRFLTGFGTVFEELGEVETEQPQQRETKPHQQRQENNQQRAGWATGQQVTEIKAKVLELSHYSDNDDKKAATNAIYDTLRSKIGKFDRLQSLTETQAGQAISVLNGWIKQKSEKGNQ